MAIRYYTVNLTACGDTDDAQDALNAYLAGLAAAQQFFMGGGAIESEGPNGVEAPGLDAGLNNNVNVVIPNFVAQEGVSYSLKYSDNDWQTMETLADVQPNDVVPHSYNATRKWRVYATGDGVTVVGPSAGPVS